MLWCDVTHPHCCQPWPLYVKERYADPHPALRLCHWDFVFSVSIQYIFVRLLGHSLNPNRFTPSPSGKEMTFSSSSSSASLVLSAAAAFSAGSLLTAWYLKSYTTTKWSFPATLLPKDEEEQASKSSSSIESTYPVYDYENDPKGSFLKICDMLVDDIIQSDLPNHYQLPPREVSWLQNMLNTTVKGGKMNRGLMVVDAGVSIWKAKHKGPIDNTTLCRLAICGWAIEWLQAWLLIADDIMDCDQ